jgi:hypothetical protein
MAVGDYDNDGDLDVFISNMGEAPSLLRNQRGEHQNFLSIFLVGTRSNRDGIGAKVTVLSRDRKQFSEVRSGSSFLSHHDFRLHFGLGKAAVIDRIEIQWPSGVLQTIKNVKANQFLTIKESESGA